MGIKLKGVLDEVRANVVEALKIQGFGILTEIDVQKTLKEKIGVDFKPYLILGACNPQLAQKALATDESIGLLLPCNVVLKQKGDEIEVSILELEAKKALAGLPQEAKNRLQAALSTLESQS
jgi:uncharacterized protein (DUF302 family)